MNPSSVRLCAGAHSLLLSLALALALGGAAAPAGPPTPGAPGRPEWTQGLGMRDLEGDIRERADAAVKRKLMEAEAARALLERLERLEAEERGYRDTRTFTAERFKRIEDQLLALAGELPFIPAAHPPELPPSIDWVSADGEPALDLKGFSVSFADEFDRLSVTADGGAGPWFAPVHASFGEAVFEPPTRNGPFSIRRSGLWPMRTSALVIRASRRKEGWRSGLMQTVDSKGRGFAQTFGYFEMRAQLPRGFATWPAFWLLTQTGYTDATLTRGELDVLEQYGSEPDRLHSAIHLWPAAARNAGGIANHWYKSKKLNLPGLSQGFHRFGVMVTPSWTTVYYDGRPLYKAATLPAFHHPLYVLVDLTMHAKHLGRATDPSELLVDYVRVYAPPKAWAEAS